MHLHALKLVTVVGESVIMADIAAEGLNCGATGYTMSEVNGQGARSARNVAATTGAKTMKLEFVVAPQVAEAILGHVSENYFEHYAVIAWSSDVQVVRGQQYVT